MSKISSPAFCGIIYCNIFHSQVYDSFYPPGRLEKRIGHLASEDASVRETMGYRFQRHPTPPNSSLFWHCIYQSYDLFKKI